MEFSECFSLTYHSARKKFRAAANSVDAALHSYRHPNSDVDDPLYVDVACFGRPTAPRRLAVVSGTHGLEGFCGSALQVAWIKSGGPAMLGEDTAVLMVHAINPWGFANLSRGTENNVDLNRNFMDFSVPLPKNFGYGELHERLLGPNWTSNSVQAAQDAMDQFEAKHGADTLFDTLARGQYDYPEGLSYGGNAREWSNYILEKIVCDHLTGAEKVGFIDWHTGIGEYGEPFFLCFHDPASPQWAQAIRWWGAERIAGERPHGRARPDYQGLLYNGLQCFLDVTPLCGAVIEFGTRGWQMRRMLRLDIWLRFHANRGTERYLMHQADLLDAFCPVDQVWRDNTLQHGQRIMEMAVAGLESWQDT